ncbi:MAG: GNAT family N-acetyltransferase [Cyanobacteria bacterium J06633_8]
MQSEFPILETPRLILRQINLSDAVSIQKNLSDAQTVMYSNTNQAPTREKVEKIIKIWQKRFEEQKGIRWGITKRGNDEVIGSCGYKNLTQDNKKAEIGYEILVNHRRQGLMSEALNAVIRFGFETIQLNYIEATVNPHNLPSIYLLNKIGFIEEDLLEDNECHQNKLTNLKLFVLHK